MSVDLTAIPLEPPAEWFSPPAEIPTDRRVTIEASGRVYGYIALWNACHVGMSNCTPPPKGSPSDYQLAHTGVTLTAEGEEIPTANIGGGVGHFGEGTAEAAARYHGDITSQLMRVRYGEDENGLWFAGSLWPDVTELDVQRIRATSLSGDWRFVYGYRRGTGGMDFTGAVLVNVPGFPLEADGGVSTEPGQYVDLAASLMQSSDVVLTSGCVECQPEGVQMCECKNQKSAEQIVAAIVEPATPEDVANIIDEVVTVHAIATIEDLLSILRPKADGAEVETSEVEPDAPEGEGAEAEGPIDADLAAKLTKKLDELSTEFANLKAAVLAESV